MIRRSDKQIINLCRALAAVGASPKAIGIALLAFTEDKDKLRLPTVIREMAAAGASTNAIAMVVEAIEEPVEQGRRLDVPPSEWALLRAQTFERDNFICAYCFAPTANPHCDHVFPLSKGGKSILENLATACQSCNCGKRDRTIEEWRGLF